MSDGFDREAANLDKDLEEGFISDSDYKQAMTELRSEYEEQRQQASQHAYDNY